jgi:uncharacterized protein YndB with AHSA1/START domain
MATLQRSTTVSAPVGTVFDVALDVARLWTWEDVTLSDVDLKPEGVGTSARIHSRFLGFDLQGTVEYTEVVPGERIVAKVHFFAERPTWTFTFAAVEAGTEVTAEGDWTVNVPLVGSPIEKMMVKEHAAGLESMLANLKTQVEARSAA